MPPLQVPPIPPVPVVIPSGQYPHLREIVKELDFPCAVCSAKTGAPVYRTFLEAVKEPLSAPHIHGKAPVTRNGMYATRFVILCPECRCAPKGGPFIEGEGIIDLLTVPKGYKRPERPTNNMTEGGISYDDAEAMQSRAEGGSQPAVRTQSNPPRGGRKKVTDLNDGKPDKAAKAKRKKASGDGPAA